MMGSVWIGMGQKKWGIKEKKDHGTREDVEEKNKDGIPDGK
jgi:hypothetical protein